MNFWSMQYLSCEPTCSLSLNFFSAALTNAYLNKDGEGSIDPMHQVCCGSVTEWGLTLCEPMDYSTPGSAILHHLPAFTQTHVH